MATFLELTDTPVNYTGDAGKYLQVDGSEGNVILNVINLTDLNDTNLPAPGTGQVLTWSGGSSKWIAQDNSPYSAGNGINFGGSGQVINVVAGTGGGLTSNTNGIYIADSGVTAGTYGNATYVPSVTVNSKGQITAVTATEITLTAASSLTADYVGNVLGTAGQITVTGGTGNNSNATLNLVATGVTAGVYGNTTHAPRITVDTYGRISSVDTVAVSGGGSGGNASLGFANINVSGQTTIGAEKLEDDLTLVAGTGMAITTNAADDTITFGLNSTSAAQSMSILNFSDVNAGSITNGQVLVWNNSTAKFEPGAGGGGGGAADQTLSISGNVITISGNNDTVDLTTMLAPFSKTDYDAQDLTISGNVISLSKQTGNVDLTSILGSSFSTSDVDTHLNQSDPTAGYILSWNGSDYAWIANSGATGPQGATGSQGPAGTDGKTISTASVSSGTITLTLNDGSNVIATGNVQGTTGPQGATGSTGATGPQGPAGGGLTDVISDTTPQLGGDLDINGKNIISVSNQPIELIPDGSGVVIFHGNATRGAGQFKLNCENNSHGITIKGPAHSAAANYTLTLPTTDGNADQVLKTDGSGGLAWVDQSSGGGATTLDGLTDVSASTPSTGQVLKWNGSAWTNQADSGGGGGSGATIQRFKLNYLSSGNLNDTSDKTTLINSVTVDSATGGDVTVTFDSSINYPPASIMIYGYDYTNNKYYAVPLETTMGLREIAGGGSSGSPTLFNGSSSISLKLRLREAETGASRGGFGTTTHAWVEFVVYD